MGMRHDKEEIFEEKMSFFSTRPKTKEKISVVCEARLTFVSQLFYRRFFNMWIFE